MSDARLAELERWKSETEVVLGQLKRDVELRAAQDDVERGKLFASIAKQLQTMLDQIEPVRREMATRMEMQERYDELNEVRFDLLRGEIRRLDQQLQQVREGDRESWHETTGLRELEELSSKARLQRSMVPPPDPRRRRNTNPEASGRHAAVVADPPSYPPSDPPKTSKKPDIDPAKATTTAQAGVAVARIVFSDQSVVVRFVAVLTLLVVALTVLLLALRAVVPALLG